MTFDISCQMNLEHVSRDVIETGSINKLNGTKYVQLDDTQRTSFDGFHLSRDRLKDNPEDVDDDAISLARHISQLSFSIQLASCQEQQDLVGRIGLNSQPLVPYPFIKDTKRRLLPDRLTWNPNNNHL